jgi:hypothetical protein
VAITPIRHVELALQVGERRGRRRVARDHQQLDVAGGQVACDLVRVPADHLGRLGAVREARRIGVAEVQEVLVGQRHQALVEDGQTAHPGVEHADRPCIHPPESREACGREARWTGSLDSCTIVQE